MEFRSLGTTGVQVSALCLGVAFRGYPAKGRSEADCVATIERAVELGVNFIDCANIYGRGWSEELLGRTIKRLCNRDDLVITTKVGSAMGEAPNQQGLARTYILSEIERSLRRLQLDHVDVYLIHVPDPTTPLDETLRAMDDVVRQGKARYIGVSNHAVDEVVELLWAAERNGLASPALLQYQYSLLSRWDTESDIVPLCHRHGLGLMTYSPLAVGMLTGQVRANEPVPSDSYWYDNPDTERVLARSEPVVAALVDVALESGKTPAQVAIAWLLANPAVSAPILGPELPAHVEELAGAVDWQLPADAKAILDQVSGGGGPFQLIGDGWRGMRQIGSRLR